MGTSCSVHRGLIMYLSTLVLVVAYTIRGLITCLLRRVLVVICVHRGLIMYLSTLVLVVVYTEI